MTVGQLWGSSLSLLVSNCAHFGLSFPVRPTRRALEFPEGRFIKLQQLEHIRHILEYDKSTENIRKENTCRWCWHVYLNFTECRLSTANTVSRSLARPEPAMLVQCSVCNTVRCCSWDERISCVRSSTFLCGAWMFDQAVGFHLLPLGEFWKRSQSHRGTWGRSAPREHLVSWIHHNLLHNYMTTTYNHNYVYLCFIDADYILKILCITCS